MHVYTLIDQWCEIAKKRKFSMWTKQLYLSVKLFLQDMENSFVSLLLMVWLFGWHVNDCHGVLSEHSCQYIQRLTEQFQRQNCMFLVLTTLFLSFSTDKRFLITFLCSLLTHSCEYNNASLTFVLGSFERRVNKTHTQKKIRLRQYTMQCRGKDNN